jgi:hypothetical protein
MAKVKQRRRFLCGVPEGKCSGTLSRISKNWKGSQKTHASRDEAFECYVRHLLAQGYVRLGPKEFQLGDGPILLVNKRSQFGGVMRQGKAERWMPRRGSGEIW